jgi:NAD(P)-dependent dehydrogenase (short-subunit alcohol dehydrogenase family)
MNPTYDFNDQVTLVTGASSGMGFATARAFAEAADTFDRVNAVNLRVALERSSCRARGTAFDTTDVGLVCSAAFGQLHLREAVPFTDLVSASARS